MANEGARARQYLRDFDFKTLFIEELGWDRHQMQPLVIQVDGTTYYSGHLIVLISSGGVLHMFFLKIFRHDMRLHLAFT